jgi:hypothetical protein
MQELWVYGTLDTRHENRDREEIFGLINKLMEGEEKKLEK